MKSKSAFLLAAILTLSLAATAFGQAGPRTYGSATGFGSILFPGTGGPPPLTSFGTARQAPIFNPGGLTFPERLSGNIQGRIYPSGNGGRSRGNTVVVPYAVPVYYGGGYGYGGYPPQDPNVTIVQQPAYQPQASSNPVVINQYFSQPSDQMQTQAQAQVSENSGGLRLYEAAPSAPAQAPSSPRSAAAPQDDKPAIYLIAFKGGAIYPTLAYWVEGDTLQYITMDKNLNKASLDLIDRDLSTRLNNERHVDFSLPGPK